MPLGERFLAFYDNNNGRFYEKSDLIGHSKHQLGWESFILEIGLSKKKFTDEKNILVMDDPYIL